MPTTEDSNTSYTGDLRKAGFVEADLTGATFLESDLTGVRVRDCNLTGAKVVDSWLIDLDLSGEVRNLTVNEVRVDQYISDELDRRQPIRAQLRAATTVADYRAAWQELQRLWDEAVRRVEQLPDSQRHQRVDGEWSFVQTMRHLVFATDGWLGSTVLDEPSPFHPYGLPYSGYPRDHAEALEIQLEAKPSFDEMVTIRRDRQATVTRLLSQLTDPELERSADRLPAPGYPQRPRTVRTCLTVVMKEECEHLRYALRDLDRLADPAVGASDG